MPISDATADNLETQECPGKTTPKSHLQCFLLLSPHNFLIFLKGEIQKSTGEFVKTDGEVARNLRGDVG